ncbi:unnamed protein product [Trichogramma brassicae]|uniref:Uncharacterized protein n=1 Tax=Trichogramma brassicae TaxID=86971 RepID=A0A6H5I3B6_9HYME|nr:unnamed protein product [Trichogramma brassicae]
MSTTANDGLQSPAGAERRSRRSGVPSWTVRVPPSSPRTPPPTMVKAITTRIIAAPLHCKERMPTPVLPRIRRRNRGRTSLERNDGLIQGLGKFIEKIKPTSGGGSLPVSLVGPLSAVKSAGSQVPHALP